jgi:hemoglobin/transferrin/lactoferrin receptor protein
MMNNLMISYDRKNGFFDQMILRLAHQRFEESRMDRDFNDPIRRTRKEKVTALSANLDFLKNINTSSKIFYGIEGIVNDVSSRGQNENILTETPHEGPARYPNSTWTSLAAYVSYQNKISPTTLVQMGLRYNHFGLESDFSTNQQFYPLPYSTVDINNAALTGSMGVVYTPRESWTIHVNASTGFRSPNVDDIGKIFDSEPGTVLVPNPNLKAEYAYNTELNIGKVFGDHVMLDLTGYYTYLDHAIVRRDFTLSGRDSIIYDGEMSKILALQNAAQARIYGIQGALEIKFSGGFSFSSRLNYQKGVEETDDGLSTPSKHAPPPFGVTRLEYERNKLRLQLYSEYSGEMSYDELPLEERGKPELYALDELKRPFSPSWTTLNLKGFYKISPLLSLTVGLENMADIRYRTYSSGIVAPGRNFILSLQANF